jgi:hypothetical protein
MKMEIYLHQVIAFHIHPLQARGCMNHPGAAAETGCRYCCRVDYRKPIKNQLQCIASRIVLNAAPYNLHWLSLHFHALQIQNNYSCSNQEVVEYLTPQRHEGLSDCKVLRLAVKVLLPVV